MPYRNPNKYRTMLKRKRKTYTAKTSYKRRKVAARQQVSMRKYRRNKMVSRALGQVAETQCIALKPLDEISPTAIQIGALAQMLAFRTGPAVTVDPTSVYNVDGFTTTQGVSAAGERTGNYIYLKKTHVTVEIDMNAENGAQVPCNFRTIVFKRRRNANIVSNVPTYQKDLFLNNVGNTTGHSISSQNGSDLMLQPINKKEYIVFADRKYTLTPMQFTNPAVLSPAGYFNTKYSSQKKMVFTYPHYKKTHYDNGTNNPDDYDANWYCVTYAKSIGKDNKAGGWEVNVRGTTTFTDL